MADITLRDIAAAVQIIDIACSRGAIRGEEMSDVGQVRKNLHAFVKEAQEKSEAESVEAEISDTNDE